MAGFFRILVVFAAAGIVMLAAATLFDRQDEEIASAAEQGIANEKSAPVEPDYFWTFNALDPTVSSTLAQAVAFDPADDYWGLPREEGYELVAAYCSACHSLRIVMQQRADAARWDELLDWMVEKQGMPEPLAEDRAALIAYLSSQFGE